MSLSKNLEYLRKSKKMSQEDLAFKLGVSRQAVSKWESGAAYPETEKIIAICKLFDCSLDELMKDDIAELREDEKRRYTFNDLIEEVSSLLQKTVDIFNQMDRKTRFRFFFELVVACVVIFFVVKIPFNYIASLGYNVFFAIGGDTAQVLRAIWRFLVDITYFITSLLIFISVYKAKFLNIANFSKKSTQTQIEGEKEEKEEGNKEEKIVRHDFGVFSFLGKVFVFCLKVFVAFLSLFILFYMLVAVAGLVVVISWMFDGVFLFSLVLFALSFILLSTIIIYVIYNFIVNRRSKWKKVFTFLLISFIGLGVSMGVGAIEMKEFTFTSSPRQDIVLDKKSETFEMTDSLIIENYGYEIVYIEDEKMQDMVRVEVAYYSGFEDVEIIQDKNSIFINSRQENFSLPKIYEMLIKDLKEKEIRVDYRYLSDLYVTVYTSKENIEKIQNNIEQQQTKDEYDVGVLEEKPL